jgi:hypothetical protein
MYITELPLRVWVKPYIAAIESKCADYINYVFDQSDKYNVLIKIVLNDTIAGKTDKPIDYIKQQADFPWTDGVEEFFMLREPMHNQINLYGADRQVIEFNSYADVIRYWYPYRRDLYKLRIERKLLTIKLEITALELLIRYVKEYRGLNIVDADDKLAESILEKNNYPRIYKPAASFNFDIETGKMEDTFYGRNVDYKANYDYLLDTTDKQKLQTSNIRRVEQLAKLNAEYDDVMNVASQGKFMGAKLWLNELDELEETIRKNMDSRWGTVDGE